MPPAPRAVVERAAVAVLGAAGPVTGPLVAHGPAAVRRRWTRALVPAALLRPAGGRRGSAPRCGSWRPLVLPVAAGLALDRARALGHALVDGHLVARSGSMVRRRSALRVDDVIGWNFRATWFQRRVGLTTLVATTAGGGQAVPSSTSPRTWPSPRRAGPAGPGQPVPRVTRLTRSRALRTAGGATPR